MTIFLQAIPSTPRNGEWDVLFRYVDEKGREVHAIPAVRIPCTNHDHAVNVAHAFNKQSEAILQQEMLAKATGDIE